MKIYNRPKAYLISKPKLNWEGIREFFNDYETEWTEDPEKQFKQSIADKEFKFMNNTDADRLPEFSGRICYCSFGKKQGKKTNRDYLMHIIEMGHGSVLEHSNFTFLVARCNRGLTHELVRHRAGFAFSQESTHYIDYSEETGAICIPENMPNEIEALKHLKELFRIYQEGYNKLRAKGIAKKDACSTMRNIFPIALESKIVFTANIRALRHFIETRGTIHNVADIRDLAIQVYDILNNECPNAIYGISKFTDTDGKFSIETKYKKI